VNVRHGALLAGATVALAGVVVAASVVNALAAAGLVFVLGLTATVLLANLPDDVDLELDDLEWHADVYDAELEP
jgi:hypothetical protein